MRTREPSRAESRARRRAPREEGCITFPRLIARGKNLVADLTIEELRQEIPHYCELGDRVIDQARRRVLQGEQVPHVDKIYSIF